MTAVAPTNQLPPAWTKEEFTNALKAVDARIKEITDNLAEYRAKEAEYTQKVEDARRPHEAAAAALQTKAGKIQTDLIDTLTPPANLGELQALVQTYEAVLNSSVDADKLPDDAKVAVQAAVDALKQLHEQGTQRTQKADAIDQAEETLKRAHNTITTELSKKIWNDSTLVSPDKPIADATKEADLQGFVQRAKDVDNTTPFTGDEITKIIELLELRKTTASPLNTPQRINTAVAAIKKAQENIADASATLNGQTLEEARAALPATVTIQMVQETVGELKDALEAAKTKADELVAEANGKAQEAEDKVEKPEGFTPPGHVKTQADNAEAAANASAEKARKPWGQVQAAGIIFSVITGLGLTGLALVHFRVLQKGLVRLQGTRLSDFATKATQTLNRWADATAAIGTTKLFAPVGSATAISVGVTIGSSVVKGQLENKAWGERVKAAAARYEAERLDHVGNPAFQRPDALKALKDNHQNTFYSALAAAQ